MFCRSESHLAGRQFALDRWYATLKDLTFETLDVPISAEEVWLP